MNKTWHQMWQERLQRSGFFFVALLLHLVLFLLVATWVIFEAPKPPQDPAFGRVESQPVKVPPPPEPTSSGDSAYNPQFEPDTVVVPVVTPPTAITTIHSTFNVDTSKILNQALSHMPSAAPQGTDIGRVGASGNGGDGSAYGSATGDGSELVGYLYDLKQTPDRKPTDIMPDNPGAKTGLSFLRSFVKDWNMSSLDKYYKTPAPLYATQIFIPLRKSNESTKAFGVDGIVEAKRWIIVYNGKATAPETGTFRFVGFADDFMVVRWNGENVLDASYEGEELDTTATEELAGNAPEGLPFKFGKWIQVQAGQTFPIQIMIGEGPGGDSGFMLMVQKQDSDGSTKGDTDKGDYPVFQVADGKIPTLGPNSKFSYKKILFQGAP